MANFIKTAVLDEAAQLTPTELAMREAIQGAIKLSYPLLNMAAIVHGYDLPPRLGGRVGLFKKGKSYRGIGDIEDIKPHSRPDYYLQRWSVGFSLGADNCENPTSWVWPKYHTLATLSEVLNFTGTMNIKSLKHRSVIEAFSDSEEEAAALREVINKYNDDDTTNKISPEDILFLKKVGLSFKQGGIKVKLFIKLPDGLRTDEYDLIVVFSGDSDDAKDLIYGFVLLRNILEPLRESMIVKGSTYNVRNPFNQSGDPDYFKIVGDCFCGCMFVDL